MRKLRDGRVIVELIESGAELIRYFRKGAINELCAFDWETTSLSVTCKPLGISFCIKGENPVFVPVKIMFSTGVSIEELRDILNTWLPKFRMVGHNTKFDSMINILWGIKDDSVHIVGDSLILMHLYDPSMEKNLERRVLKDFKYGKETFEEIIGKKWTAIDWETNGDDLLIDLARYGGADSYWTLRLYEKYYDLCDEDAHRIHDRIEIPMMYALRDAKIRGVRINVDLLHKFGGIIEKEMERLLNVVYEEAGCYFNLGSSKQKADVFINKLGLPILKTTKSGAPSTDADVMEQYADMGYAIGEYMVQYSEINKLYTSYIKNIPEALDENNILRGDINSCGTQTGRCSSSNPNLQNQPNNSEFPIREAFVPREGYKFINYDYSQLELRVMAHMSKDKHFIEVFQNGGDPHGDVAQRIGITRKGAKVVNFGVLYGMSFTKLAKTIDCTPEKAQQIIEVDYMRTYTGFAKWKRSTEKFATMNGYVKNLFGRKRVLKNALHGKKYLLGQSSYIPNKGEYYGAMRRAVNTIIQGTGADIVKRATIAAIRNLKLEGLDAHFLLQVHDELLFEVREDQILQAEKIIIEAMEQTTKLIVPLDVDGKIIQHWGEMKNEDLPSYPNRFLSLPVLTCLMYG